MPEADQLIPALICSPQIKDKVTRLACVMSFLTGLGKNMDGRMDHVDGCEFEGMMSLLEQEVFTVLDMCNGNTPN